VRPDDVIILVTIRIYATGDDVSSGSICLSVTDFMRPVHLLPKVDAHFLLRPATQSSATNIWVAENVFSCSQSFKKAKKMITLHIITSEQKGRYFFELTSSERKIDDNIEIGFSGKKLIYPNL
jgi:hypothetical protein